MAAPNYEVRNRLGICIYTSPEASLAKRFARLNSERLGELRVEEVTIIEHRRRVWTSRQPKPSLAAHMEPA